MTRVVFAGTPEFAVPSLAALLASGYDVVGVLTRPDQPSGRGRQTEESAVKRLARANGLHILQPPSLGDLAVQSDLAALSPELIVVAAYGLLIPQSLLALPRYGCVNVHGSLLPRWRGASPISAAILAGDGETGITLMHLDAGLDTGPIIVRVPMAIGAADTTSLSFMLARLGAETLSDVLPGWLRGEFPSEPQDESQATLAPRLQKADGQLDWNLPAEVIARAVRAYNPWPSAYTSWNGLQLKVLCAHAGTSQAPAGSASPPGTVQHQAGRTGIQTGEGVLWLAEVQLAGKRILPADVFIRGAPGFAGSRLPS